jgi:hypothetical protein
MNSRKMIPWCAALAWVAVSAGAQTATAPAPSQPPTAIGVSPQTAAEANQKAIPRSDTGTVVRTAPSPAERTGAAVENATSPPSRSASGSVETDTSGSAATTAPGAAPGDTQTAMRRPRLDRN